MTSDRPEFVTVPGGTFRMGKDGSRMDERPAHMVTVGRLAVAISPVSNAQYAVYVAAAGIAPAPFLGEERFAAPGQPVVGINWFEANAYCAWLGSRDGGHYRLPSEAEREFAALGGLTGTDWPWEGNNPHVARISGLEGPHVPRPECANGYGLRCMAENVHEWCNDWYAADYYAVSPGEGPAGPESGQRRASRGGSWRHREKATRVNARSSLDPSFRYSDFGFRVYCDVVPCAEPISPGPPAGLAS
jgi:formylglycine-generating enzyme required for sulfatase activity